MLLTKKSAYALLSLIKIANSNDPINVDVLSKELNVSKSFLAKILQNLAKQNVITSIRGINGGFVLNKSLDKMTIFEIVSAAENRTPSVFECSPSANHCPDNHTNGNPDCHIWPLLNNLQLRINSFLEELTLKDLTQ